MPTLATKKTLARTSGREKAVLARAAKLDPRLSDAENYLVPSYKRPAILFTHGRGCYVYDSTGKKYLDFLGGIAVNALGHAHPRIVKVIRREAARAIHLSNLFHHAYQGPLARKLAECSGMDRVFFANSGAEAMEGAMRAARLTVASTRSSRCRRHFMDVPGARSASPATMGARRAGGLTPPGFHLPLRPTFTARPGPTIPHAV